MPERDVVVVGGGIVGAAIFHELAAAGAAVTMVERHRAGHGVTAGSGGVVRCFDEDGERAGRAAHGWRWFRLLARRAALTFHEPGFLYLPPAGGAASARRAVERLAGHVPVEWLDAAAARRAFGHLAHALDDGAAWEPRAGWVDAGAAVRALVAGGLERGGRLLEGVEVRGLAGPRAGRTGVETSAGTLPAAAVVLATGPQTPALLDAMGVAHDLYAKFVQVDLRVPGPASHPAFVDDANEVNGRPDPASGGVWLGHTTQERCPAPAALFPVDAAHALRAERAAARRFSWVTGSEARGGVRSADCFSAGGRLPVRMLEGHRGVVLAAGFNGAGFRMAPWAAAEVGRLLGMSIDSLTGTGVTDV